MSVGSSSPTTWRPHGIEALHFTDGREGASLSGRTFETRDPSGKQAGVVSFGEAEDVERAVDAAWRAYDDGSWRSIPPARRAACLRQVASLIRDRVEEIARVEAIDSEKPLGDARASILGAAGSLEYASTLPENVRGGVFAEETGLFSYTKRERYGVVAAIAPWNFPFSMAVSKTAAALAVGNSVILKMAEQTPLSTSIYARLAAEAGLPPGVLNVIHGDGPTTGAALAAHPHVPKVTFTGSTEVGKSILRAAADSVKNCDVELGGKSPNIILQDADLEQAIAGSLFSSFFNAGQVCSSGSRLLVHEQVADEVTAELCSRASALAVGDPLDEATKVGPLVSAEQLERVTGYVAGGRDSGASIAAGGGRPALQAPFDRGFFLEPTIFVDVDPQARIAQEEIFGPVLSVVRFADDDEAIRIANDISYGLAATVWTNSLDRALQFAERLQAGIIWTNCPHTGGSHIPWEAHKESGMGELGGLEAIGTFTKLKTNHISITGAAIRW